MSGKAHGNLSGKRLVVFGCGYVGGELARQAVARGLRVGALTRNAAKAEALQKDGIDVVVADLAESGWYSSVAGGADFAVNCVSSGGGGIEGARRSYVEGTASILRWARATGRVGTLVYTGSTSVYPQGQGVSVDESATVEGGGERAGILLAAENLIRMGAGNSGEAACGRAFVLRLAGIYGPGRHHLLDQVRSGEVAGCGDFHLNMIHRDDICAAIWNALLAPVEVAGGTFNIADDGATRKVEIVAWLAARLGRPVPHFSGEPTSGRRRMTPDRVIQNARAKAILGWQPQFPTFREGYENLLSP